MTFETDRWQQPSDDVTRSLPYALGPEKSVLSTLLQDPQEFIPLAIEENLTPHYFYLPSHATLFETLLDLFAGGKEIEFVSLIQRLLDSGKLDRVGGPSTLTDLYTYQPSSIHFIHHVNELRLKFSARETIKATSKAISDIYDSPEEVLETIAALERDVMAIRDIDTCDKPQTVRQSVSAVIDEFKSQLDHEPSSQGLLTGYDELDRMTQGGLRGGEMFVVGARPSVGKTSFLMNIAENICVDQNKPCLIFSAEMSFNAITRRMIFSRAKFAIGQLSRGYTPTKGDLQRIQRASLEIADAKLFVDPKTGPSIGYITAKSRRMKREHDIQFIGIDYLQLCKSGSKQAQFSREREIAEISAGVKALAKDLNIPILILAQLSRDVEKRAGKGSKPARARMSDLRESGSVEQDADLIGMLSRDDYQSGEDDDAEEGRAGLDIVKNRNGATGLIPLTFIADLMRFETGSPHREMDPPPTDRERF